MLGTLPTLDATNSVQPYEPLGEALRSQLGLKLEKELGPITILIVDAAERPTRD
jgi:uncharacterized protein (TIGR03435 family)